MNFVSFAALLFEHVTHTVEIRKNNLIIFEKKKKMNNFVNKRLFI